MQRFIAELSHLIDNTHFEAEWQSTLGMERNLPVKFRFEGKRVMILIDAEPSVQWRSDDLRRTFSDAVHRVDQHCNIRWL